MGQVITFVEVTGKKLIRRVFVLHVLSTVKNDEKLFLFLLRKLFTILRYLYFWPDFFGHVVKRLGKKAKVKFKIIDVTN